MRLLLLAALVLGLVRVIVLLLVLALGVGACGQALPGDLVIVNTSRWPDALAYDVIDAVHHYAYGNPDLAGYKLYMHGSILESGEQCKVAAGCAIEPEHLIHVPFSDPAELGTTEAQATGLNAGLLAHELGHVYYAQLYGDIDPMHEHSEWFDYTNPDSMCGTIMAMFLTLTYELEP